MTATPGKVIPLHHCPTYDLGNDTFKLLLKGKDNQHNLTLIHSEIPPQKGSPLHRHQEFEEAYYLLEGQLDIVLDHHHQSIQAGTLVYVPRHTHHRYFNPTEKHAKILIWAAPGGIEDYIIALSEAKSPQEAEQITQQYDFTLI